RAPMLRHRTAALPLPRWLDRLLLVARQRPVAAGRSRRERTACGSCEVSRLLDRLHRASFGRLDAARPLATDPGKKGGPGFVVMATAGLALRAAAPWPGAPPPP